MTASIVPDSAGFEAQLLRVASAQLYLVDGEESLLMKHGDFVVRLTKQSESPLAVVLASVGDVHWPLGKDSPTLQMRSRHFAFVLSGLIYGLVLPESTPAQVLVHLRALLTQYSTFEVHQEQVQSGGATHEKPSLFFWTALAPEILRLSVKLLGAMCDARGAALASTILEQRRVSVSALSEVKVISSDSGGLDPTPRSMKRIHQARRISAVSKLLSRTLVRGALSASNHVAGMRTTQMGSPTKTQASTNHVSVASVDAIAKLVDAVESAGKSILTSDCVINRASSRTNNLNQAHDHQEDLAKKGSRSGSQNSSWTLNRTGLALLFRATAASAKLYSSYRSPSTQASSTQDYMNCSGAHDENNSDNLQEKSFPSHDNMTPSETCRTPAQSRGLFSSSKEASSSLPELSLFPNPGFNSSLAPRATQPFISAGANSPQEPSAQQQQQPPPPATPAMPTIGFTPFLPTSSYVSNRTFGQNFGRGAPDRQHFYHSN